MSITNILGAPIPFSTQNGGTGLDGNTLVDHAILVQSLSGTATQITLAPGQTIVGTAGAPVAGSVQDMMYNVVTGATQAAVVNNAYIVSGADTCVISLPVTASLGDSVLVIGQSSAGWVITQSAAQRVRVLNTQTTTGSAGSVSSVSPYAQIKLTCYDSFQGGGWIATHVALDVDVA